MSQIIYKGNVYAGGGGTGSVGQVNLTARIEDPTEMELTQEQIDGTEPIRATTTYDSDGNANIDITLPVSLIINNGVLVNDAQKNMIFKNTQEVNEVALDKGYRYVYGDGGKRFIWQGIRVLFGKTNTVNPGSATFTPGENVFSIKQDDNTINLLPDGISQDDSSLIQNFITPDDLYTSIPFYGPPYDNTINTSGTTQIKMISKTDSTISNKIAIVSSNRTASATYICPSDVTSYGLFFFCQDFSQSSANVRVGFAAFKENILVACYPCRSVYAEGYDTYWLQAYSWGSTAEFNAAAGITAKYTHVTKTEFEEISGITIGG